MARLDPAASASPVAEEKDPWSALWALVLGLFIDHGRLDDRRRPPL
jgi:hypothetical protein